MKALVTGGAGFIGSALCRYLVSEAGVTVLNVDKLTYAGNLRSLDPIAGHPRYHFVQLDICDRSSLKSVFENFRPDAVFHLAAESHVDRSITGSAAFIETNINGIYLLLETALDYWRSLTGPQADRFRFLNVSTDEVYGSLGQVGLFSEQTPYDPSSPYSATKAAADHLVMAWHRTYGLPALISNCSNNFGPYHFPEKLIPLVIINGLEGKQLPVYGDGQQIRDWLFVDDHVRALHLIVRRGRVGTKYNVGSRSERTNLQVVQRICELLDDFEPSDSPRAQLITFVPDRPGHDRRYAIDPSRLEEELDWRPQWSFEEGLARTVKWFVDNRAWWQPLRRNVYDGERLGLIKAPNARVSAAAT